MASDKIIHIGDSDWDSEVIQSVIPVLVDFWAEWCAPCRAIAPVLDELADEFDGVLKIVKVDVDKNPRLASQFGVRSIPTLLVIKEGAVQEQMVGSVGKSALQAKIRAHL